MNKRIIKQFEKLVDQIDKDIYQSKTPKEKKINSYRLENVKKALETIKKLTFEIKSSEDLKKYKGQKMGIGEHTLQRIDEILATGKLSEIKETSKDIKYARRLEKIFGIGKEKALDLVTNYKIKSFEDLYTAYKDGKIKLDSQIELGLKYYHDYQKKIPREEISAVDEILQKYAGQVSDITVTICGSYRREKETSNDIDVLIYDKNIVTVEDLERETKKGNNSMHLFIQKLIKKGLIIDTLASGPKMFMGFSKYEDNPVRRIDFIFVPYESAYTALLHFTGSKNFNTMLRNLAKNLGLKLNRYGLTKLKNNKKYKITSEKDIFTYLNLEYVEPKYRD